MTTINISNCKFNLTEKNGKVLIERVKGFKVKRYKRTFQSMDKAIAYCERMAYMSELYTEAKQIAKHFGEAICAWMYRKAKRVVKMSKEIFQFNAKLKFMTD